MDAIEQYDNNYNHLETVVYAIILEHSIDTTYEWSREPAQEAHCLAEGQECHGGQAEIRARLDEDFAARPVAEHEEVYLSCLVLSEAVNSTSAVSITYH